MEKIWTLSDMAEPVVTEDLEKQSLMTNQSQPYLSTSNFMNQYIPLLFKAVWVVFFAICNIQYSMLYSYYLLKVYYVPGIIMRGSIKTNSHNHIFF